MKSSTSICWDENININIILIKYIILFIKSIFIKINIKTNLNIFLLIFHIILVKFLIALS